MLTLHQVLQELSFLPLKVKAVRYCYPLWWARRHECQQRSQIFSYFFIWCFHCLYLTAYREAQPSLSVGVTIPEYLRLGDLGTSEGGLETHKRKSLVPASSRHGVMWRKEGTRVQWEPGLTFLIHLHNKHALLERLRSVPLVLTCYSRSGSSRHVWERRFKSQRYSVHSSWDRVGISRCGWGAGVSQGHPGLAKTQGQGPGEGALGSTLTWFCAFQSGGKPADL